GRARRRPRPPPPWPASAPAPRTARPGPPPRSSLSLSVSCPSLRMTGNDPGGRHRPADAPEPHTQSGTRPCQSWLQQRVEEGAGALPLALGGPFRAAQQLGDLGEAHAGEVAQLDDLAALRVDLLQRLQALVQGQDAG